MCLQDVVAGQRFFVRSPRRRFRIGDLMTGIAMAGLGLAAISLPDLTVRERLFLGLFAVTFLSLLRTQWALANMRSTVVHPALGVVVGFASVLMALCMFVCLTLMGFVFPQAAALLSAMMLLQVVYLATWE